MCPILIREHHPTCFKYPRFFAPGTLDKIKAPNKSSGAGPYPYYFWIRREGRLINFLYWKLRILKCLNSQMSHVSITMYYILSSTAARVIQLKHKTILLPYLLPFSIVLKTFYSLGSFSLNSPSMPLTSSSSNTKLILVPYTQYAASPLHFLPYTLANALTL